MDTPLFRFSKRMVLYHALAWFLYAAILFFTNSLTNDSISFASISILTILFALIFYAMLWVFRVFYRKGRYLLTVAVILAFSFSMYVLGHWYIYSFMPELSFIIYLKEGSIYQKEYLQNTVLALTRFTVYSFVYYKVGVVKEKSLRLLKLTNHSHQKELELALARNEALQYENELLTAQVDPHYIHNKINVLYGRLLESAPEEAESVLQLNDIVVYMMTPSIKGTGWVLIEKEVEHLQHAMNLDLSKAEKKNVNFTILGEMEPHLIPYMTLLTLFDNIIKYGVVNDSAHPVRMELKLEEDSLSFIGENKIKKNVGSTITSHGTGLANLMRRLDIGFPGNNKFSTEVVDEYFTVNLLISY